MGVFVSLEGPDGSGKTTQIGLLRESLEKAGYRVLCTREPGGPSISEEIRKVLLDPANQKMSARTEVLLYAAARAQHVEEVIRPALEAGYIVISDRFTDSSLVYQGIGRKLGVEKVREINAFATDGLEPDLTLVVQIDYEEGLRRKARQQEGQLDRLEQEKGDFHRRVHDGFAALGRWYPRRVHVIDGAQEPGEIHEQIMEALQPYLQRQRLR